MKLQTILISVSLMLMSCVTEPEDVYGCTDSTACNFNPNANIFDNSCLYLDCNDECGGAAIVDECGVCGGDDSCMGCNGCNYNLSDYDSVSIYGDGDFLDPVCYGSSSTGINYSQCNEKDVKFLNDLISLNSIHEGSSIYDINNHNGLFEISELGQQHWNKGRLDKLNLFGWWYETVYSDYDHLDVHEFNYGISGIPESINNLDSLIYLDLDNNNISYLPNSFGELETLEVLWIGENPISNVELIWSLINLKKLGISGANLSGEFPPEIGLLTNLEYLTLHSNQLTGEIPFFIGNLTNLEYLYLDNNQLTGEIPLEIGNLTNLDYLRLNDNQLTGEIPVEIGNLTNLEGLYLNNNHRKN